MSDISSDDKIPTRKKSTESLVEELVNIKHIYINMQIDRKELDPHSTVSIEELNLRDQIKRLTTVINYRKRRIKLNTLREDHKKK